MSTLDALTLELLVAGKSKLSLKQRCKQDFGEFYYSFTAIYMWQKKLQLCKADRHFVVHFLQRFSVLHLFHRIVVYSW